MKLRRKGNPNGLDIDYEVTNVTPEEADELHKSLLKKGFLFTYSSKGPYTPPTENIVLHYVDKDLKLYDYDIMFTNTRDHYSKSYKREKGYVSFLDEAYEKAKTDTEFREKLMAYMRYEKLLNAFSKYIKLHGEIKGKYLTRLNKVIKELKGIPVPDEYTPDSLKKLYMDLRVLFLS